MKSQRTYIEKEVITDPQVGNSTQVKSKPQVERVLDAVDTTTPAYVFTKQDSSVEMEARAAEGLERGYTRIPNQILMQLIGGELTRNEMRIVLLVARFTISFRREQAPLSKRVLERQSGLRGAAVLEAVTGLVAKGLVRKTKGDEHRPNMLGLVLPDDWDLASLKAQAPASTRSAPVMLVVEKEPAVYQTPVETMSAGEVQIPTPIKDIKKYKTSQSTIPEALQIYFDGLKPARKRESEVRSFSDLSKEYDVADIADCLRLLIDRGVRVGKTNTFQPCHSPMAYLSKAMADIASPVMVLDQTDIA